jgi:two-component system sensor histidine kinase SenX3
MTTALLALAAAVIGLVIGWFLATRQRAKPTSTRTEFDADESLPVGSLRLGAEPDQPQPASQPREPSQQPTVDPPSAEQVKKYDALDIERALADLRLAVVVTRADGAEVYRNARAMEYATGRHGAALVEAALQRVIEGARLGLSLEETVEIFGPPARSLLVQASPTYRDGELNGAVGVIDDITEFQQVHRVRSDFVANVSHELRTPVGAISVLAETIADADDPAVVSRMSARMVDEANRLADTIDDLLALSRLESGPISDPETIDLVSVASMAMERTAGAAAQRPVTVTLAGRGPVLVDGDQGQLVSAVANLVDNAIKYSDPDGDVTIQIQARTVKPAPPSELPPTNDRQPAADRLGRWEPGSQIAELTVHDEGIGIPARDLDRIFERFYRVDAARSRDTGGTGLGLSIVRNALLNHRGTIDVESVEGQGSTFTLRVPLSPSQLQLGNVADELQPTD